MEQKTQIGTTAKAHTIDIGLNPKFEIWGWEELLERLQRP